MKTAKLYIKNMVCDRCVKVVREELQKLGYDIKSIELGKVEIIGPHQVNKNELERCLTKAGFELLDDSNDKMINEIKSIIINQVHYNEDINQPKENLSQILEKEIGRDYSYISNLFSTIEGRTIAKFIIQQKVEKVKELLKYGELTINEIAFQLNYSSPQYLSNQFKQIMGFRPSQFRTMLEAGRNQLDKV
ncbi:MAG: AraC family transcriptional regulator [Flavobacteriales bacterium]|nr:MAG: AraC family transcriptional regulator [Flavobacteriales bacterium]